MPTRTFANPFPACPAFVVAACTLAMPAATAAAQGIQDVEPYVAVVTASEVPMRSGDMRHFYEVVRLSAGDRVLITGESADWARIRYPDGLQAFLVEEDARVDASGETLTLLRPSRLRAVNRANTDPTASWKPLLTEPLPANTTLSLVGRVPTKANRIFLLVEAPSRAEGFVALSAVRRATSAEAAEFFGDPVQPVPEQPAPIEPEAEASEPELTQTEQTQPETAEPERTEPEQLERPSEPAPASEPQDSSLLEPMAVPTESPAEEDPTEDPDASPVAQPEVQPQADPQLDAQPEPDAAPAEEAEPGTVEIVQGNAGDRTDASAEPEPRPVMSAEDLESALQEVLAQPVMEGEVEPLLFEFERTLDGLEESPLTDPVRRALERRIAVLELRRDYQRAMRANERITLDSEAAADEIERSIDDLSRTDVYVAVGLLQPSTVYDGERLPLLYRVRSVDDGPSRTLGYIAPTAEFDLPSMLGRIVGVVGFAERDADRNLRMLRPRRVNVVDPADVGVAPE